MVVIEALFVAALAAAAAHRLTRTDRDESDDGFSPIELFLFWPLLVVEVAGKALAWFIRKAVGLVRRRRSDARK